ncbi:hypothetical protein ACWEQK_28945 [Streptomyces parvulus]
MRTTFVWDDTYRWSGVIYAPDVPLRERRPFFPEGLAPYKLRQRRFRNRWDGRAILLADLLGSQRMKKVQQACEDVWRAAKPFAGMVDLVELEHRLGEELWTCAQLEQEISKLVREGNRGGFETRAVWEEIQDQIDKRRQQLEQLTEEYKALYAEAGADAAAMNDVVAEALARVQVLDESRPIQDAVIWAQSLREIVAQHNTKAGGGEESSKP